MKVKYIGNYFQLPNNIFAHKLTGNAFMLYSYLISKSEGWIPKKCDIQAKLGLGRDAVDVAFKVLIQKGFLIKDTFRTDKMGKVYQSYKLNPIAESEPNNNLPDFPKKKRAKKNNRLENPYQNGQNLKNSNTENPHSDSGKSTQVSTENPLLLNKQLNKELNKESKYNITNYILIIERGINSFDSDSEGKLKLKLKIEKCGSG